MDTPDECGCIELAEYLERLRREDDTVSAQGVWERGP